MDDYAAAMGCERNDICLPRMADKGCLGFVIGECIVYLEYGSTKCVNVSNAIQPVFAFGVRGVFYSFVRK